MLWHLQTLEFSICLHSGQLHTWKVKLGKEIAWRLMEMWCFYAELRICRGRGRRCLREGQFKDDLIVGPLSGFQVHKNAATEQKVVATEDQCAGGCALWVKARQHGALYAFLLLGVAWGSSNGSDGIAFACDVSFLVYRYLWKQQSLCPSPLESLFFAFCLIRSVCWERLARAGLRFSVSLCHQRLAVFHPTAASCKCCQAGCEQRGGEGFYSSAWLWAGLRGLAVRVKVSAGVCPGKCSQ